MTDIIRLKQQEAVLRLLFQNEHKDVEKRLRAQKNVIMAQLSRQKFDVFIMN